ASRKASLGKEVILPPFKVGNVTYLRVRSADEPPRPMYNKARLPALLFLSAGAMTLFTLVLLSYFLPDLFRRTLIWAKTRFRYQLEIARMLRLPANGPTILVTDAGGRERLDLVRTAADRVTHFLVPDGTGGPETLVRQGQKVLARGDVIGLCVDDTPGTALLLSELLREA